MGQLFLWIYRLDYIEALFLLFAGTGAFFFLQQRYGKAPWWKWLMAAGCLVWLAAVVFMTVAGRESTTREISLMPFASYLDAIRNGRIERYRSNFMNAVLFYPPGFLLWELLPKGWRHRRRILIIAGIFGLVSLLIEGLQFYGQLGLAETDDFIHNTLGAVLAAIVCRIRFKGSHHYDTDGTNLPGNSSGSPEA